MMEMQEPAVYSRMLQMFPNIPQEIIWRYVQEYSSDVEKCAQILALQDVKYMMENRNNLNKCSSVQPSDLIFNSETVLDNNNDTIVSNEEQTSYDSHSSYSTSFVSPNVTEAGNVFTRNFSTDSGAAVNFNEPLMLDIVPDDEGISHSWRPSNSDEILFTNIFVPSPVTENFMLPSFQITNGNLQQNHLEFHLNPKNVDADSGRYSAQMLYDYPLPDWRDSGKDISSYLHYQKSQMNAVRYEVIKAKIELSDIKESTENLEKELKEKMQLKSVQDIIDLNREVEQLRLDCQCLYSQIDDIEDSNTQGTTTSLPTNSNEVASTDSQEESNKWQCPNCTFDNHPAINNCEMCYVPKSVTRRQSFQHTSTCYCHTRESTLPVHS